MRTAPLTQCRGPVVEPPTSPPADSTARAAVSFPVTTPVRLAEIVGVLADIAIALTDAATELGEIAKSSTCCAPQAGDMREESA